MTGDRPPFRGVVLVGYRGTGKSTVGRALARHLGLPFVDGDDALEARFGRSVRRIFLEEGEPTFRDWEEEILAEVTSGPPAVLATGGGAVLREANRRRMKAFGFVVWLSAPADVLTARLAADPQALDLRPALTPGGTLAEIAEVLEARRPFYRDLADAEVRTDGRTPDEVAEAVLARLPRPFTDG